MRDLGRFPQLQLIGGPTPIEPLDRLAGALGKAADGVRIFVKRDDLGPVGGGGNKLRKLEFLLGQARAEGADTVITVGALQSNHARLTAAAAARHGFACELFLTRTVPRDDPDYRGNGNRLLHELFGARVQLLPAEGDALAEAEARAVTLRGQGRRAAVFPAGGSSPLGCLGYAACAAEIAGQISEAGIAPVSIVLPNGSNGTHAGLAAGFAALGRNPRIVRSFTVLADAAAARHATHANACAAAALIDPSLTVHVEDIRVDGSSRGPGYGIPTPEMVEAVRLVARTEGLLLDPVYSGKAFAGLIGDIRNGLYRPGESVLFLMTGGLPGLFAYRPALAGPDGDQSEPLYPQAT